MPKKDKLSVPVEEELELKEEPKGDKPKKSTSIEGKYLGGKIIVRVSSRTINGKELNEVTFGDGTAVILSSGDVFAQVTEEEGPLVH